MHTRSGAVICGAYGLGNLGDEAMLDAVLASLRSLADTPVTVMSRAPAQTRARTGADVIHSFDAVGALRAMRRARLLIFGGGSLLQDVTSRRSLIYYLLVLRAARALGCRVLLYGCGVGPLADGGLRAASRTVPRCADLAAARDADSLAALRAMGLDSGRLLLMSDPALGTAPASDAEISRALAGAGLPDGGNYAVLCPMSGRGGSAGDDRLYADAAIYLRDKCGLTPVCLPLGKRDEAACRKICRLSDGAALRISRAGLSPALAAGIIGRGRLTVSSRLHGLVFSAPCGVPAVGIARDPKLAAFACGVGYPCAPGLPRDSIDFALRMDRDAIRSAAAKLINDNLRGETAIKSLLGKESTR